MKNIRLATPVAIPKGVTEKIRPDEHIRSIKTVSDLVDFTDIISELYSASQSYRKLLYIGGPEILIYRCYQKLQNAVWKLYDRFPAPITEGGKAKNEEKRTVNRPGDLF